MSEHPLADAYEDQASVIDLTSALIEIPSQAGIDMPDDVLNHLYCWFRDAGIGADYIGDDEPLGLFCTINGTKPGPTWILDACIDTAPIGDESTWKHPPTKAVLADDWLHGRGAGDSKVACAIFAHIARRMTGNHGGLAGKVVMLFDADEHTGRFGGAREFFANHMDSADCAGVMIGYPGYKHVVIGSRGFARFELMVHGIASHSGAREEEVQGSAIIKATQIVSRLRRIGLTARATKAFPHTPRVSVTGIQAGEGFSQIPDLCKVKVDVRTTPTFTEKIAASALRKAIAHVDHVWYRTEKTEIDLVGSEPAYRLDANGPLVSTLMAAAAYWGVRDIETKISGPSNVGNYLASMKVPATAGFGVPVRGYHAANEAIDVRAIPTVQAVYHSALLKLMNP